MAEQNYEVNYTINVEATKGVDQVRAFAQSVESLARFRTGFGDTAKNVSTLMKDLEKIFPDKKGNERRLSYAFTLKTGSSEARLKRIKKLLDDIKAASGNVSVSVSAGKTLNSRAVKANAQKLIEEKSKATTAVESVQKMQKTVTRAIGKINAALTHLQTPRELTIKTAAAESSLQRVLALLRQIRAESRGLSLGSAGAVRPRAAVPVPGPSAGRVFPLPPAYRILPVAGRPTAVPAPAAVPKAPQVIPPASVTALRGASRMSSARDAVLGRRQRAAINRLQYSQAPSLRNLMPFAYMLNGYMLYSAMRSEVTKAVEYANILESARSILNVADTDLSTFSKRFDAMALKVRTVGVQTKFTAVEVAGAVKFLAMAGQSIDTINESIRPIANLALIGDNDISQIADLTTNIMAGYDIRPSSMNSVADVIASTISRSNVNIIETAEAFKMSAGFLQNAGVEFSEASAVIGLLGNMGVKGTMAGTSLRAMATRFAAPPREARKVLDRLGVELYRYEVMYGKRVEKLKPIAQVFEELNKAGATSGDIHKIFGRIGGNAGIMLLNNYDKLRELTLQNRASHGISGELAQIKQETTKGLWYQMTSQLSETFMQGFEIMEPQIQRLLKDFLSKFKAPEFVRGLASLGSALLDIFSVLGKLATWFGRNFNWLEPLLFTGLVASKLFKLTGAVINLGVALRFLGKQSVAASGLQLLGGLAGAGGKGLLKAALSFGQKRALVAELSALGISGKGAMTSALAKAGLARGATGAAVQGAATGLFATQVATGKGLIGAGASIGALGATAVVASAGIAALAGALGWVAYKTWQLKKAKDAVLEDVESNKKYRYKSLEDLYDALEANRLKAEQTRSAVNGVKGDMLLKDKTGQPVGALTGRWLTALNSTLWSMFFGPFSPVPKYSMRQALHGDLTQSLETYAEMNVQQNLLSAWAELGKLKDPLQVEAFMRGIPEKYSLPMNLVDSTLFRQRRDGSLKYIRNGKTLTVDQAQRTAPYIQYYNREILTPIEVVARKYADALHSYEGAKEVVTKAGFDFEKLEKLGFERNKEGLWAQKELPRNATDEDRRLAYANYNTVRDGLVDAIQYVRKTMGGSELMAANIMEKAGFSPSLYSNEPQQDDPDPFNRPGIKAGGADDGGAGGNYSGTGKLSSATPKQVIVNIGSLLEVKTIDLLKSPEGQTIEIQNLKEQLAQALIDTVHDFDASWNG